MNQQPLLILCISFILGIFVQEYFLFTKFLLTIILVLSVFSLLLVFIKNIFIQKFKWIFLGLFFFSLGIFCHFLNSNHPEIPEFKERTEVVFKLDKKLNSNEKNKRYEITFFNNNQESKSVLSVPKSNQELDFKHFYKAELYINKAVPPNNDYQFDYSKYLRRKDIFYQSYLPNDFQIADRKSLTFSEKIKQRRVEVLKKINQSSMSSKSQEFLKVIILADRTEMDHETVQDFNKTGLVHLLAISGSHMVIIFWLILLVLKPLFSLKFKNFAIIIALIFIWLFAVFIDYGSSVMRSCLMITSYYTFVLLQRKPDLLHSMALAAFMILVFDTNQIFDVGFQLSFLAVFGIFWLNQPILKYFPKPKNDFQNFLMNIPSVSLSAQIATLPLVLFYFHQYSFISIVANLVIIPLSELIIVASLLLTILMAFGVSIPLLEKVYDGFIQFILKVIHWFSEFNFLFFENVPMGLLEMIILLVGIYFLRFVIKDFKLKNIINFGCIILIFCGLRLGLNYNEFRKEEALVHHLFKERVFSIKDGKNVVFWMDENADQERMKKYVINPYLTSRRIKNYETKSLPKNSKSVVWENKTYNLE